MSELEKLYYNMHILNENYVDTDETKKTHDAVETMLKPLMSKEVYLECEDKICACMAANEKQGFVLGFQYAVSLLMSGKVVNV